MPIKFTTTTEGRKGGKKKKERKKERKIAKRIYRTSQHIRITNIFLELLLSESFPSVGSHSPLHLPRMPSNSVLISGPAVGAAHILIWSYSCVFLPPVSTTIRTSRINLLENQSNREILQDE